MSITRAEILAVLDTIPRVGEKHKQRVSWELLAIFNQLKLWHVEQDQEEEQEDAPRKNRK